MSRSAPYNIIVSRSAEAIERLFFDEVYQSRLENRTRSRRLNARSIENLGINKSTGRDYADDLIITPFNNNEFISFETQIPGGGSLKFSTLRLAETRRILEKFIIPTDGVSDMIANQFRSKVKSLRELSGDILEQMKRVRPRYYISFGVGDDVSRWAGPFIVDLIDANILITSEGLREIELGFTPTVESIKIFTNKIFKDEEWGAQGKTIFDTVRIDGRYLRVASELEFGVDSPETGFPTKLKSLNDQGDTWNYAVRNLIRQFLRDRFASVPESNIIVLFPHDIEAAPGFNLDVGGQGLFKDIVSLYRSELAKYGIGIAGPVANNPGLKIFGQFGGSRELKLEQGEFDVDYKKSDIINQSIIQNQERLIAEQRKAYLDPGPGGRLGTGAGSTPAEQEKARKVIAEAEKKIEEARVSIGMRKDGTTGLGSTERQKKAAQDLVYPQDPEAANIIAPGIDFRSVNRAYSVNPDELNSQDKLKNIETVILSMLSDVEYNNIDDGILEVLRPLYTFFSKLKSETNQIVDITVFEENDLKTTRLLEKHGLIQDSTAPVVVLGDANIVSQLMYEEGEDLPEGLGSTFSISTNVSGYGERWKRFKSDVTRDIRDIRGRTNGITSSFNEKIDFGPYVDFGQKLEGDMLVFMHNLKNSNVLSINVDSSPYKGELLNLANESIYKLIDYSISDDQELFDNTFAFSAIDTFIQRAGTSLSFSSTPQDIFNVLKTDTTFLKDVKNSDTGVSSIRVVDFLDLVRFKYKVLIEKEKANAAQGGTSKPSIVKEVLPGRRAYAEADIIRKMNSYVFQVQIRTLPFFNTNYYLNRRCLLMGVPNKIIGSRFLREDLPPPSIFSNTYRIFGYKHSLTPNEAYSEFELYQDGIVPTTNFDLTLGEYLEEELKKV